jgi:hypothetical protein
VLESTLVLDPANWQGIQTNAGGGTLNFNIPVNPAKPTEFFRIRAQP